MHIAVCIYDTADGKVGGPIAWALDFVPYLATHFETTALVIRPGGESGSNVVTQLSGMSIRCVCVDSLEMRDLNSQVEWIYDQARELKFEVLIANLVLPGFYAAEGLRRAGVRVIGVLHSHPTYDPYYRDIIDVFASAPGSGNVDCLVAVSRQVSECVPRCSGSGVQVEVIPCGTRLVSGQATQTVESPRLIYAGRLVDDPKRITETVDAFLAVSQRLSVTSTILGDGDRRDWVKERLDGKQVGVRYAGCCAPSAVHSICCDHQVFVLLSDFEGLPIALVEAMACGLVPVGLASAPGTNEVIVNGVNGLLVEDRGESFVEAIRSLKDVELRTRLSQAARKTVETCYSHSVTFAKWRDLLERTVPERICPERIPRKCVVRNRGDRFPDYPANRPGRWFTFTSFLRKQWNRIRLVVRPRSRMRALFGR